MIKTNPLSWEEWKTLGILLARVRDHHVDRMVCEKKTKKEKEPMAKQIKKIDIARSILDDIVFTLFPQKENYELTHIIYPLQTDRIKVLI